MIYQPPSPPPAVPQYVASDCKRGSRDCFPQDRVGWEQNPFAEDILVVALQPIAPLVLPSA